MAFSLQNITLAIFHGLFTGNVYLTAAILLLLTFYGDKENNIMHKIKCIILAQPMKVSD